MSVKRIVSGYQSLYKLKDLFGTLSDDQVTITWLEANTQFLEYNRTDYDIPLFPRYPL